ncbi:MAG: lipid-binding protein [Bdellovibrionales bacterium CG12_big_fil_rev_8_21_14_0_65_38_15]|nr:MAG: lipid-binding protein [Bdellovibrionales bacterium CG22_combo_CG10-13_8_21_14_all_38_13]PIQ54038.1 MAG: lipid-binding protein [Bdellovibrionales bacterium CG12_big_fil_rev_8_21_14_0_65_38_15]PIR28563.1 MAG: lipid-binding protein [Bdellovibrionales bacterium CG11_big_fil_rev_8_21_14_0_20_38_13]
MKFLTLAILSLGLSAQAADYSFNAKASKLEWEGKKISGAHMGEVSLKEGKIELNEGVLKGGEIQIDLSSITTTDLQGEWADKLVGHLKSDDFFSAEKHPTATFKIDSAKKVSGNKFKVTGPLTIKGKSAPQTFEVSVKTEGDKVTVNGDISIDRTTYDIKYGSGKFFDPKSLGDKMINDKFTVKLNLVANK